jgi:hypothetical protein
MEGKRTIDKVDVLKNETGFNNNYILKIFKGRFIENPIGNPIVEWSNGKIKRYGPRIVPAPVVSNYIKDNKGHFICKCYSKVDESIDPVDGDTKISSSTSSTKESTKYETPAIYKSLV